MQLQTRIPTAGGICHHGSWASAAAQHSRSFSAVPETVDSSEGDHVDSTRKWYTNPNISARAAAKIVKQRLEQNGPQRVSHLMELARRIKTPEEAALAIEVAQKFALHRARRQQHDGISPSLSAFLLKKILEAGEVEQALEVLRRSPELQLTFQRPAFRHVIIRASQQGNLRAVVSALEVMKAARLRPNRDIAFHVLRGCFENDRPDLAVVFCREFEANGLPPRPAMKEKVEAAASELEAAAAAKKAVGGQAQKTPTL
ncbi:hypothetical protein COCOBI_03-7840 [Coccomyxa sp. Obi]|nr:hypothetical protein COCOBI_03-7840 [Coccomyxa sp. Obi]